MSCLDREIKNFDIYANTLQCMCSVVHLHTLFVDGSSAERERERETKYMDMSGPRIAGRQVVGR